jgi:hypothetical protein
MILCHLNLYDKSLPGFLPSVERCEPARHDAEARRDSLGCPGLEPRSDRGWKRSKGPRCTYKEIKQSFSRWYNKRHGRNRTRYFTDSGVIGTKDFVTLQLFYIWAF